jgi:hypothetical protein
MHLVIALVVSPISGYLIFWISLVAGAQFSEGWQPAWLGDTSYAEILAYTRDNSGEGFSVEFTNLASAPNYTSTHPRSTFLIPIEQQKQIQKRLEDDLKLHWDTFEIKKISDDQEEITFFYMDRTDDSRGSRYKASKDSVQLESYRYISDRGGIGIVMLAMVITLTVHVLLFGFLLIRAILSTRKKSQLKETPMVDGTVS